jgi:pyruvate dehydrogenase E2 component (dihydrolipoamide acetyltransferase)
MGEFRMPSLGADMDQGTLVEWRVRVGDRVERGDIVAVVDTDKATIDVEVFESGVVEELLVEEGTTVPVGTPLARIGTGATPEPAAAPAPALEPVPAPAPAPEPGPSPEPAPVPEPVSERPVTPPTGGTGRHQASVVLSPLVRHLAEELGVDTSRLAGSGPGGRVTRADVERAARRRHRHRASPRARRLARERGVSVDQLTGTGPGGTVRATDVPAPPPAPAAPPSERAGTDRTGAARAAIARTMERSWREIPHYRLGATVDLEPLLAHLGGLNADRPPRLRVLPAAALLRAAALAARAVPDLNGWWVDGGLRRADTVDVGHVISLRSGGIVTPTVPAADTLDLDATMAVLREQVERARRGGLRSSDMAPASMTVTNLGDQGAEEVHGVIHPPQVALVGFGRITARPWADGERVTVHRTVRVTLAADHRASDGRTGSRFLRAVEQALTDPARLAGPDDHPPPSTQEVP